MSSTVLNVLSSLLVFLVVLALYIYANDRKITCLPEKYASLTTKERVTPNDVRETAKRLKREQPRSRVLEEQLPSRTGRRYIVVGGGGFVGGWIATQLLDRGEDPRRIRLLDIRPPPSSALQAAIAQGVQFIPIDIRDAAAMHAAFSAPWPKSGSGSELEPVPELTVFHTAATIRFYERFRFQLPLSTAINVTGTENVVSASLAAGATVLVSTSSASVSIRACPRLLLWPWESIPSFFVQVLGDSDQKREETWQHEHFFSNYAVSKRMAEVVVRGANATPTGTDDDKRKGKILRTGCIRPGNGVFGPRGDMLHGAYIVRRVNPTWIENLISSHCYVENCALAHLLYERCLVDLASPHKKAMGNPDIGGQAFTICDPGPAPTYGDIYTTLTTLTKGECIFPHLSPTFMLLFAHVIEFLHVLPYLLSFLPFPLRLLSRLLLPRISGTLINLQPSLFSLVQLHLVFSDARARLPVSQGGLGYIGAWTTLEGVHKTAEEHYNSLGDTSVRAGSAGVDLNFKFGLGWDWKVLSRIRGKREKSVGNDENRKVVTDAKADGEKATVESFVPLEVEVGTVQ